MVHRNWVIGVVCWLGASLPPHEGNGRDSVAVLRPAPVDRIVEEVAYDVERLPVDDSRDVMASSEGESAAEDAEDIAAAALRSMAIGDFAAWRATWDEGGRIFLDERLEADYGPFPRRTAEQWCELWTKLKGCSAHVVAAGQCPGFVVICYEVRRSDATAPIGTIGFNVDFDAEGVLRGRMVLVREADRWVQTGAFNGHPVVLTWRTGNPSIRLPAKASDWNPRGDWPPSKTK